TLRGVGARAGDPAEAIRAAGRSRDEFRAIVATLVELVTAT
ncbi:MAG: hypothetical protein QOH84_2482, partial [Kribbellaceae bacterium]|nr:hypothetical protein [Kribbellaceae bacterium]